jgi:glycerophosphoryl diester phosphodiesterase
MVTAARHLTVEDQAAAITAPSLMTRSPVSITVGFLPARPGREVRVELSYGPGGPDQTFQVKQDAAGRVEVSFTPSAYGPIVIHASAETYRGASAWATEATARVVPAEAPEIAAHRGNSRYAPENTLPAFASAMDAGADLVEADAQLTADGAWVLMHDSDVRRTTDAEDVFPGRASYAVSSFTLVELRSLNAGWPGTRFDEVAIPTVDELLQFLQGKPVGLLLEAKTGGAGAATSLLQVVQEHPGAVTPGDDDQVQIGSFDPNALIAIDRANPDVELGFISAKFPDLGGLPWADALLVGAGDLQEASMGLAEAAGLDVYAWTVNDDASFYRLADLHVTGLVTDDPAAARLALHGTSASP